MNLIWVHLQHHLSLSNTSELMHPDPLQLHQNILHCALLLTVSQAVASELGYCLLGYLSVVELSAE